MSAARQASQWDHTAALLVMLHNVNSKRRDQIRNPDSMNPWRRKRPKPLDAKASVATLSAMLLPGKH